MRELSVAEEDRVWFLDFGNPKENFRWGEVLIIDPTHGTMDVKFSCRARDPLGIGCGDTPEAAAISFAESLQKAAADILTRVAAGELRQSKPRKRAE